MSRNIILSPRMITKLSGCNHNFWLSQNPLEIGAKLSISAHEREKN